MQVRARLRWGQDCIQPGGQSHSGLQLATVTVASCRANPITTPESRLSNYTGMRHEDARSASAHTTPHAAPAQTSANTRHHVILTFSVLGLLFIPIFFMDKIPIKGERDERDGHNGAARWPPVIFLKTLMVRMHWPTHNLDLRCSTGSSL